MCHQKCREEEEEEGAPLTRTPARLERAPSLLLPITHQLTLKSADYLGCTGLCVVLHTRETTRSKLAEATASGGSRQWWARVT